MSKAVLISIRPKWCEKICSGEKTIEVRKTSPKLETPFKVYIYCTAEMVGYDELWVLDAPSREKYLITAVCAYLQRAEGASKGNRKVIGEFICDRIYELETKAPGGSYYVKGEDQPTTNDVARQSCLTLKDMHEYLKSKDGYGWHISELKIYDAPKELIEFHTWKKCKSCSKSGYESTACIYDENCMIPAAITKAPQSWGYVEEQK